MDLSQVSLHDWITFGVAVIGFLTAYLSRVSQLPSWARSWLKKIGANRITKAIEQAASIADLTPDQRRKQAVIFLQRICLNEVGLVVPASIANLLVEFVYQQWKRARK